MKPKHCLFGKCNFDNIDIFIVKLGNYKEELKKGNEFQKFTLSEYIRTNKLMLIRKNSPDRMISDQANSQAKSDAENESLDFSRSYSYDGFETSFQAENLSLLAND